MTSDGDARPRRPRRNSPCFNGGYDLRATPERCPECGADFDELGRILAAESAVPSGGAAGGGPVRPG